MLELTQAFEDKNFHKFNRKRFPNVFFAGMTLYDGDTQRPQNYLVSPPVIHCTLSELLCQQGMKQLACSETQKFGHITYFWNGNRSGAFDSSLEKYIEIPSFAAPFDTHPAMKACEITDIIVEHILASDFRFIRVNFANGDMLGHTGNLEATKASLQTLDLCLRRLDEAVKHVGGALVVTADHGNAEEMAEHDEKTGQLLYDAHHQVLAKTSHTCNLVPFCISFSPRDKNRFQLAALKQPGLANIASTLAVLLGFEPPEHFLPPLITFKLASL